MASKTIERKIVYNSTAPSPAAHYNLGVQVGNAFYVAGQLGWTAPDKVVGEGIEEQTRLAMENTRRVLESAGLSLKDVVKMNIYLSDINLIHKMNAVYEKFFSKDSFPARVCFEVVLPKGFLIEVEAIAYL